MLQDIAWEDSWRELLLHLWLGDIEEASASKDNLDVIHLDGVTIMRNIQYLYPPQIRRPR